MTPFTSNNCDLHSIESQSVEVNDDHDPDNIIPEFLSRYYNIPQLKDLLSNNSDDSFSVFHCNTRSLSKHIDSLQDLLVTIDNQFSLIGISETKLNENSICNVDIPNYIFLRHDSPTSAGGVGLYIHNSIKFLPRNNLDLRIDNCENLWVEIELSRGQKNIIVGLIYRHPNADISQFSDALSTTLDEISNENKQVIILGDINIDLIKYESNHIISEYLDMLYSNFCFPVITQPTRITDHSETLIDHIYTNVLDKVLVPGICFADISDHFPIFLSIESTNFAKKSEMKTIRDFKNFCKDDYLNELSEVEWNLQGDVNSLCSGFLSTFTSIVNKHIPVKSISKQQRKLLRKPWITPGLLRSIKHKHSVYYHCFVKGNDVQKLRYKQYSNMLNRIKEQSKRQYYKNKIFNVKNNTKEIWRIINQIIKLKSKGSYVPDKIIKDGVEFQNSEDIANQFNLHFRDIGPSLASKLSPSSKPFTDYLSPLISSNSFFVNPTNPQEIHSLICSLDSSKASGPSGIPLSLIKIAASHICSPLSYIFNESLSSGTFPDALKLSKIIPLYKGGASYDLSNYRPISLLSPFSKILEKLMYKRLLTFLDLNDTLFKYQFGFRKKHSTSLALIEIIDHMLNALDKGLYVCGVFVDLSKAFDTVDHSILLSKLSTYGVRGVAWSWFKSYLISRPQYVDLKGVTSSVTHSKCGVPQGSILGPLLFLIYMNDIANCSEVLSFRLFADDTNIFMDGKNSTDIEQIINPELDKLANWLNANKLSLNLTKSKYMIISSSRKEKLECNLLLNNNPLDETNCIKYLGVYIDQNLTWSNQISIVSKKIAKNIGMISKLRHYVDLDTLRKVYFALVYPYLQYGAITWANTYKSRLTQLNVLNNKAVRLITFSHFQAHAPPLYKSLGILQLKDIVFIQIALFMYDYLNNHLPQAFQNYFMSSSETHSYETRYAGNLNYYLPNVNTNFGKFSLKFLGPKIWSCIDGNIKQSSRSFFVKKLKRDILDAYL